MEVLLSLLHLQVVTAEAILFITGFARGIDDLLDRQIIFIDGLLAAEDSLHPIRLHLLQALFLECESYLGLLAPPILIQLVIVLDVLVVDFYTFDLARIDKYLSN